MQFKFQKFQVYHDAKWLHKFIISLTIKFTGGFYYLADQMKRAALSVILNIAEGSAKNSDKDFKRYVANSLGSANELLACLEIALESKLISEQEYKAAEAKVISIINQLGGLYKKLS